MKKILGPLTALPNLLFFISLMLIVLLGYLDYLSGDFSFDFFYLAVIFIVTWYTNFTLGIIFVAESVIAEVISDYYVHYDSVFQTLYYWNWFSDLFVFSIFCYLVSVIRNRIVK